MCLLSDKLSLQMQSRYRVNVTFTGPTSRRTPQYVSLCESAAQIATLFLFLAWVSPKLLPCGSMFEFWKLECLEHSYGQDYWNSQKQFMHVRYSHSSGTRFVLQLILWPCGMENPRNFKWYEAENVWLSQQPVREHVMLPNCYSGTVNDGRTLSHILSTWVGSLLISTSIEKRD
jgi:hypothetical protein